MQRFRNAATPSSSWKKCGALFDNPDWNAIHIYIFYALKKFKWSQVSNQAALHCIGIISEREKIYWKSNALNILKTNPNKLAIVFGLQYHISYCSRGRNAAHNSLHILRMFSNAANWNYLILSITKSNFLFICVSGSIKLKQWLLYASKILLFFSFICNVSGISSRVFMAKNDVDVCAMQCESWKWWMKKRRNMKNSMKWKPFNMNDVILLKFQLRCLDKCDSMNFSEKIELNLINDVTSQFIWNKEVMDQNGIFNRKQKSYVSLCM